MQKKLACVRKKWNLDMKIAEYTLKYEVTNFLGIKLLQQAMF